MGNQAVSCNSETTGIRTLFGRRHSLTEIMRKTVLFCREERAYVRVEREMAFFPEFACCEQSQSAVIEVLCEGGAMAKRCVDRSGRTVSRDDDSAVGYVLQATPAALAVAAELDPKERLASLFEEANNDAVRYRAYASVLALCMKPRTFKEVETCIADMSMPKSRNAYSSLPVYPSAIVAELEDAGGLCWEGAWKTTESGLAYAAEATAAINDEEVRNVAFAS